MIQIDRHTVIQVLGGLMNRPDFLNDIDKYNLVPNDFPTQLDKFVFSAIYNLYLNGAEKIHTADVDNFLKENSYAKEIIEKNNGLQFIQDCEVGGDSRNFNVYYNKLKKINLIRDLQRDGYPVDDFYCEDPMEPKYNEINSKFEELTCEQILNVYKGKMAGYEKSYVINSVVEESNVFKGIKDLIKEYKKKPEVGVPLQGRIFNSICRGARKGKLFLRSASTGVGKALLNSTKIPTTEGWKKVGDIKEGDYLFDRFGKPTKVLKIYPQAKPQQVYKITFKSGRIAECSGDHLWSYYSNGNDKHPNRLITATTKEILENPKGLRNNQGAFRWSVPIIEPVQYTEKKYSITPYVMGLILGDGSFRYNQTQKAFSFSSADEELVQSIQEQMKYFSYKKSSDLNYNWTFKSKYEDHENVWVEDILKDYPELWQAKSEDKFIPDEYLFGSVQQRFDLLAGLLDTDGSIDEKGRVGFTTVSPKLRDNLIELCESLGMNCSYGIDKRAEKYSTGECYDIHIQARKEDKIRMFKLKRKLNRAYNYLNNNKRSERKDRDSIVSIEPTDRYEDMTCFYVDNIEHLFAMNNFIVTHNTRGMVGDACQIAYPIKFDVNQNRWVSTGTPEKILYIMTEQDIDEIQTMVLAYLTGYNEEIFLYGLYEEEHMDRIMKAIDIMEKYQDYFLTARIPDPSVSVVKNLFRRYNLQFGVEHFFYDYIFSSPAMLVEYRDLKLREDVTLRLMATALKNLAVELNSFVMTATQLSNEDDARGFRDFRNIRGSVLARTYLFSFY